MHWSERVKKILLANTGDLKELARIAEVEPTLLYRRESLAGCDLRGQDLRSMALDGCDLEMAIIDSATRIDPEYDPRFPHHNEDYLHVEISRQLNTVMLNYMQEVGYQYSAWAYKKMFLRGISISQLGRYEFYKKTIDGSSALQSLLNIKSQSLITVRIKLDKKGYSRLCKFFDKASDSVKHREIILVGLISRKIKYGDERDFSQLSVNSFYPPRFVKVEGSELFKH